MFSNLTTMVLFDFVGMENYNLIPMTFFIKSCNQFKILSLK